MILRSCMVTLGLTALVFATNVNQEALPTPPQPKSRPILIPQQKELSLRPLPRNNASPDLTHFLETWEKQEKETAQRRRSFSAQLKKELDQYLKND